MKREYQVTESELFDFFNDKLSVEEEKRNSGMERGL